MCQCLGKYLLFVLNFVFFICGAAILGVSIWLVVDETAWEWVDFLSDAGMDDPVLEAAAWTMLGAGAFVCLVGFLGCCGACCMNKCALCMYVILVGCCLVIELVGIILAIVFQAGLSETIMEGMEGDVKNEYGRTEQGALTKSWDHIQYSLECCGSVNYQDYRDSHFANITLNGTVPWSCCKLRNNAGDDPNAGDVLDYTRCNRAAEADVPGDEDLQQLHTAGCYYTLTDWMKDKSVIIICVLAAIMVLQLIGMILGCCLKDSLVKGSDIA